MSKNYTFTSESVCSGHPDKICDSISDSILDEVLINDKFGRVAVETLVTANKIVIAGEVTSNSRLDYEAIVRSRIKYLGYDKANLNFTYLSPMQIYIHQQSPEIAQGVDKNGAGDQGMMFGYACKDTIDLMPLPISMSHRLAEKIDETRTNKYLNYLRPDGKTQVTIEYKNDEPFKVVQVVIAVPHDEKIKSKQVKSDIFRKIVNPVLESFGYKISEKNLIVNGTGVWHIGGPSSDTGVTGRKIIVDTYGGFARVGGGAFSGKDPTKVDRSGAYAARFLAKNIVAHNLAEKAEVRLAYFIGAQNPVMLDVETFDTEKVSRNALLSFMNKILDTSVTGIIKELDLLRPIYLKTATYGHFGREGFSWEKIINPK